MLTRRNAILIVTAIILILGIFSFRLIPFFEWWGLDFQNLYAFHHCSAADNPYSLTGAQCGDAANRDMYYPPFLYWLFSWVRVVPFPVARRLWALAVVAGTLVSLMLWVKSTERAAVGKWQYFAFCCLLLAQFPVTFALERGNNDVWVLVFWSLTFLFASGSHWIVAGALAGLAVAAKLYPGFAAIVIGCGLLTAARTNSSSRRNLASYAGAGLATVALTAIPFWRQLPLFFRNVGQLMHEVPRQSVFNHSIQAMYPETSSIGVILAGLLLLTWIAASAVRFSDEPRLFFAGSLAISTFFASVSYDYNLLTAYPLLLVLFVTAIRPDKMPTWDDMMLLLLGLLVIAGPRQWFAGSTSVLQLRVLLQWAWLMAVAVREILSWRQEKRTTPA